MTSPSLRIRLADEAGEPLLAQQFIVKPFSKLCRRLPADSDAWDLSNLVIDSQPVSRETVMAWLNKAYVAANGRGSSFQQQEPDPCQTFTGLYQLLAFADAVDSTQAMMDVCVAQLDDLQLHTQLGKQRLQLKTDGRQYYFYNDGAEQSPELVEGVLIKASYVDVPAADEAEVAAFRAQVAAQTEQLLFMAIKLQLEPLIERLRSFIAPSHLIPGGVLRNSPEAVFSERVLDAAVGANRLGRPAWVDGILQQRCALVSRTTPGWCQLLRPLDDEDRELLNFRAELTRDFMGTPRGTVVDVELDLLGEGVMVINPGVTDKVKLHAQVLLGGSIECAT